jgi:hypothetical protein
MKAGRICLVTTGQLSTNPRLFKEATALSDAGHEVRIVATRFQPWAANDEAELWRPEWRRELIHFGAAASGPRRGYLSLRRKLFERLGRWFPESPALAARGMIYVLPELTRAASREAADLYIAHNLGALPAAALAAARHRAALGFDAEDFHRGEVGEGEKEAIRVRALIEDHFLPRCDYVTAASDGILEAYRVLVDIERGLTLLNVFPLADRSHFVGAENLRAEKPEGRRSLYWFSQTIGPARGLEDAVRALRELPDDIVLTVRGDWAAGYERELRGLAERIGVGTRLLKLERCPPNELIRRTAEHDLGLAAELPGTLNRQICVTNKLFTYLTAGVPFVASATEGQAAICERIPGPSRLYRPGNPTELAAGVQALLADEVARRTAGQAGETLFNWDMEKSRFLAMVDEVLAVASPRTAS